MIPPCDPAILETNPQFKKLYQQLTTTLLSADGSTRANDAQPKRQAVLEDLKSARVRHAKRQIEKQTLRRLAFDSEGELSDEYRDTIAVITLYLDAQRDRSTDENRAQTNDEETLSLLAPDIDAFYAKIPELITPISNVLVSAVNDLRTIANPDLSTAPEQQESSRTLRSRARRPPAQPLLSSHLSEQLRRLRQLQLAELPAARKDMAAVGAEVLAMRAQVLERTVVLLERAKHGALAKATKAKADHLATVAQGVEGRLSVMKLDIASTIYTPETTTALTRYWKHLQDTRERLEERREVVLEELSSYEAEYRETGPLVEIVRKYGGLIRAMEDVSMEIARLEN